MKQILQSLRTGNTEVADVPAPGARRGELLVCTSTTLVSAGTEKMLMDFGKSSMLGKALAQPERVRQVLEKIGTDGLLPTLEAVFSKLDQPLPLGYCNVGAVTELGAEVAGFAIGDRVVSNGKHAEVVSVPKNLCARVPDAVSDEAAAFAVIGAIGLQGVRLAVPTLGEAVVVTGLGLIGLVTVQLLRAQGCRVLGIDYDASRLALARQFGAETVNLGAREDPITAARSFSRGRGVDAVLITASTKSNEPVHQAAQMCRKRGRIILVGVTGLELSRDDFYEKELSFQVSCSYGPGRYDPTYEELGVDYPVGYVRWTEQRNFEAVLDMMADGRIDVSPLISHRFDISEAAQAYEVLAHDQQSLGILLRYPAREGTRTREIAVGYTSRQYGGSKVSVGVIGSGNYAGAVLIPALKATGARLRVVASRSGASGLHVARKFGFESTTTDVDTVLSDPEVTTVVIATRHDSHAKLVTQALEAGKHVFVEKPLALSHDEINVIRTAHERAPHLVITVGFNRRFSPHVERMAQLLAAVRAPKSFVMTVNAGTIPGTHWTQDPRQGGRIVGEACHFIDLLRFLAQSPIAEYSAASMNESGAGAPVDSAAITLRFANGSLGAIQYLANGHKSFPKERLDVFCTGRILQLDNFRRMTGFGWPGFSRMTLWRQDKGQRALARAFINAINGKASAPIPADQLFEIAAVTVDIAESLE